MTTWYADIERTDVLTIKFEFPDGETPTDEDIMDAAGYIDNHLDTIVGEETVIYKEKEDETVST
jgi:hypothetical protein